MNSQIRVKVICVFLKEFVDLWELTFENKINNRILY